MMCVLNILQLYSFESCETALQYKSKASRGALRLWLGGRSPAVTPTMGALIVRLGFWGPLCCSYNREPPK